MDAAEGLHLLVGRPRQLEGIEDTPLLVFGGHIGMDADSRASHVGMPAESPGLGLVVMAGDASLLAGKRYRPEADGVERGCAVMAEPAE